MEDGSPKGFQVRDRRRFTETGEAREDAAEQPVETTDAGASSVGAAAAPAAEGSRPPRRPPEAETHPDRPLEITLSTFLMSLSTQALMCLGEIPNPVTGGNETDLDAVRELIDIISMLQEKTRGNLDAAEARLFENVLFDLRLRFVEKARK
ncbi:MAG: DUF1844 domain-containing protein [Deltaproteobacteria bacterium]|nr:DUF1844 domain-containing protein [Deltaproteobacteria bacterium]